MAEWQRTTCHNRNARVQMSRQVASTIENKRASTATVVAVRIAGERRM